MKTPLILALLVPCFLLGKKPPPQNPPAPPLEDYSCSSRVTIGGNYTYMHLQPKGESVFHGNLGGAQGMYEYRPGNAFYSGLEFEWVQGSTSGSDGKRFLMELDTAERLGYAWKKNQWFFALYSGFGFRFFRHHVDPNEVSETSFNGSFFPPFLTSATAVTTDYYEFYLPVGISTEYAFNSVFTLGLYAKWMPQAFSTVNIHPLGGAFWSLKNTFCNASAALPFLFNFKKDGSLKLSITPFYEYWRDGQSTAQTSSGTTLGLPGNIYNSAGCDLNFIFSF